ncbi:hypothetical protein QYF36_022236 [Acer negundo]|nr:hypothetical protein QYF36_022236 [Acer negundo]
MAGRIYIKESKVEIKTLKGWQRSACKYSPPSDLVLPGSPHGDNTQANTRTNGSTSLRDCPISYHPHTDFLLGWNPPSEPPSFCRRIPPSSHTSGFQQTSSGRSSTLVHLVSEPPPSSSAISGPTPRQTVR